jgi:hypothetical protein
VKKNHLSRIWKRWKEVSLQDIIWTMGDKKWILQAVWRVAKVKLIMEVRIRLMYKIKNR